MKTALLWGGRGNGFIKDRKMDYIGENVQNGVHEGLAIFCAI